MKKLIAIYLIGVALCLVMNLKYMADIKEKYQTTYTKGDVAFCVVMSLFSWVAIGSLTLVMITDLEYWDEPVCNHSTVTPD